MPKARRALAPWVAILLLLLSTGCAEKLSRQTGLTDADLFARYRAFAGEGFFRLSIGLEDADDLCADLDRALDAVVFMIYSLNGERCTSSSRATAS